MEIASAFQRRGLLFVLSSPSGAGKSTIARMLMASDDGVAMSVSRHHPADPPRRDRTASTIISSSDDRFDALVAEGAFLEWAHVFGHRYGTLKSEVVKVIEGGRDVLLDIDWQGTQQLKQVDPDIVRVFILPPSMTGARAAAAQPRHRFGRGDRGDGWSAPRPRSATGPNMIMC